MPLNANFSSIVNEKIVEIRYMDRFVLWSNNMFKWIFQDNSKSNLFRALYVDCCFMSIISIWPLRIFSCTVKVSAAFLGQFITHPHKSAFELNIFNLPINPKGRISEHIYLFTTCMYDLPGPGYKNWPK